MLTNDQRSVLSEYFSLEIQGGCTEDMEALLDKLIDNEPEWENLYRKNEMEVCTLFDTSWFTCEGCNWTMPIDEQDERGNWHCQDCMNEEHAYDED